MRRRELVIFCGLVFYKHAAPLALGERPSTGLIERYRLELSQRRTSAHGVTYSTNLRADVSTRGREDAKTTPFIDANGFRSVSKPSS
jgi:hypothetical protein